jgi:hypothetical protein
MEEGAWLVQIWDWSITECTQNTVMSYSMSRKEGMTFGTLVDPCLLSGHNYEYSACSNNFPIYEYEPITFFNYHFPFLPGYP